MGKFEELLRSIRLRQKELYGKSRHFDYLNGRMTEIEKRIKREMQEAIEKMQEIAKEIK